MLENDAQSEPEQAMVERRVDWARSQMFVLEELKRLGRGIDRHSAEMTTLIKELENMKGRALAWAGLTSILTAAGISSLFKWIPK